LVSEVSEVVSEVSEIITEQQGGINASFFIPQTPQRFHKNATSNIEQQ
jgi:hypothetical protein